MAIAFSSQVKMIMTQLMFDDPDDRCLIGNCKHRRIKNPNGDRYSNGTSPPVVFKRLLNIA